MSSMRLVQSNRIKVLVIDNNYFEMKNYEITYSMFSAPLKSESGDHSKSQNKGYLKVNFLIHNMLDDAVLYTPDNKENVERLFGEFENNFILLPEASETTLLEALHYKFNVICGDNTYVEQLSICDVDRGLSYDLSEVDYEYRLPGNNWLGDFSYWEEPWWARNDSATFDSCGISDEDVIEFRKTNSYEMLVKQPLVDIDNEIDKLFNHLEGKTAEVVDLEEVKKQIELRNNKWKPTIA